MKEVIGINEANTNQIIYIYTTEKFTVGDMLIIDSGKGEFIYKCVRANEPYNKYAHNIKPAISIRKATSQELANYIDLQTDKQQFTKVFKQMLIECKANAMLIGIDFSLDGQHVKYTYFSTDKLQFPKMVKYLLMHNPKRYKIEFYQVGEREYYAINGGLGVCGYELCCHSRGHSTPTITTNSLKSMGIDISMKRSLTGSCGKYQCCLLFDAADKTKYINLLPDLNEQITYMDREVTVTDIDLVNKVVTAVDTQEIKIDFDHFIKDINDSN